MGQALGGASAPFGQKRANLLMPLLAAPGDDALDDAPDVLLLRPRARGPTSHEELPGPEHKSPPARHGVGAVGLEDGAPERVRPDEDEPDAVPVDLVHGRAQLEQVRQEPGQLASERRLVQEPCLAVGQLPARTC